MGRDPPVPDPTVGVVVVVLPEPVPVVVVVFVTGVPLTSVLVVVAVDWALSGCVQTHARQAADVSRQTACLVIWRTETTYPQPGLIAASLSQLLSRSAMP